MKDRMKGLGRMLRAITQKGRVEREMAEEFEFHLQMEIEKNLASGMSPGAARRAALLEFGGVERYGERVREARRLRFVEDLGADVRYAFRSMARRPGFTAAVVATLGLGIGGTTAVFSVADALYLRGPAGVSAPFDVLRLWIVRDQGAMRTPDGGPGSYVDYAAVRDGVQGVTGVAAYVRRRVDMGRGEAAERIQAGAASHGFFDLLGVRAARGRLFDATEDAALDAHPVAVISAGYAGRLGAAGGLGESIDINGGRFTIIGVLPPDFGGLDREPIDVWVPLAAAGAAGMVSGQTGQDWRQETGMTTVQIVARRARGASTEQIAASATAALQRVAPLDPVLDQTPEVLAGSIIPGRELHRGQSTTLALWLLLVAGIVLVIACANVLSLLLARTTARSREHAIRLSLGAGRGRLVRQQLTETVLLTLLGGAAGLVIAYWGASISNQFPLPPAAGGMDGRLLIFGLATSLLIGLVLGVLPAVRASAADAGAGLRESKATLSPSRGRSRRALVFVQVTLSVVLLVGAGLLVRSLQAVHEVRPGLSVDNLLVATMDWELAGYEGDEREELLAEAVRRLQSLPGVERAGVGHFGPFAGASMATMVRPPGATADAPVIAEPEMEWVATGYLETVGTRLIAGRGFRPEDRDAPDPVAVVDEAFARTIVPGADPAEVVGSCVPVGGQAARGACTRIIGVVEGQRRRFLEPEPRHVLFLSRERSPRGAGWGGPVIVARTTSRNPASPVQVRAALHGVRPDLPYITVEPVADRIRRDLMPYRLGATLFSLFGLLALVLSAVGLYGVLSYYVAERSAEIGIRRSLGATNGSILLLLSRHALLPAGLGLLVGLGIAATGTRLLESITYGISTLDAPAFVGAAAFLGLVAVASALIPARRAAAIDPVVALRAE